MARIEYTYEEHYAVKDHSRLIGYVVWRMEDGIRKACMARVRVGKSASRAAYRARCIARDLNADHARYGWQPSPSTAKELAVGNALLATRMT